MNRLGRALTLTAAGALAAGVAIPALSDASSPAATHVITLHERATVIKMLHSNPSDRGAQLRTGDRLVVRLALFTEQNTPSGTLFVACTNVGRRAKVFQASASCQATYRFAGGDIVAQGVLRPGSAGQRLAIVGGTRGYVGVRGEVETAHPAGRYDVDVLHLTG
jgi:hypothetical protein